MTMFVKRICILAIIWSFHNITANIFLPCPDMCQCKPASENSSNIRVKCGGTTENSISNFKEINLINITMYTVSLDLTNNVFTSLQNEDFLNFTHLRRLDISSNMLRKIDKETFSRSLPNLERLKLSNNSIRYIYAGSFDYMPYLKFLDISNNPLVCNCDLVWLIPWANEHSIKLQPSAKCESPLYFKGTFLRKLKVGVDLHCETALQTLLELIPNKNQIVFEGDELLLKCRAPRVAIGVPRESEDISSARAHIFWGWSEKIISFNSADDIVLNDPLKVFDDVQVSTRHIYDAGILNSILKIEKVSKHHSGMWDCTLNSQQANLSKAITVMVITNNMKYCKSTVVQTNKGTYYWPQALLREIVKQPCVENGDEGFLATYNCNEDGEWDNLETGSCQFVSETTRTLEQFSKVNLTSTKNNALEIAERLYNFSLTKIYQNNIKDPVDLEFITRTLNLYVDCVQNQPETSYILLYIVSELLLLPKILFNQAQTQFGTSLNMLNVIEMLSSRVQSMPPTQEVAKKPMPLPRNMFVEFFNIHVDSFSGISCVWLKNLNKMGRRNFECSTSSNTFPTFENYIDAAIQIPINSLFDKSEKTIKLMVAVFRNGNLFSSYKKNNSLFVVTDSILTSVVIGAKIIKYTVDPQPSVDLSDKVFIMLRAHPYHNEISSPIPAWWDNDINDWNSHKCRKMYFYRGLLLFTCSQLGYYGLLQRREFLNDYAIEDSGETFKFPPISIYVGSFVVFFCSWFNIVTFIIFRKAIRMNRQQRHSLVNIWLAVSSLSIVFAVVLLWLCVSLSNLYKGLSKNYRVTTESDISKGSKLRKPIVSIYLVGWGIGLIICGISTAVNIHEYAAYSFCFLHNSSSFNAFLIPTVILLIFLGILILCIYCHWNQRAVNVLAKKQFMDKHNVSEDIDLDWLDLNKATVPQQANYNTKDIDHYRSLTLSIPSSSIVDDFEKSNITNLRAHLIFLILFIISWISAAMFVYGDAANLSTHRVYGIVFGVSSCLLGLFLIIFYTLSRNDTVTAWSRCSSSTNILRKRYQQKSHDINVPSHMHANKTPPVYDASISESRSNSQCSRNRSNSGRSMKGSSHKNEQVMQNIDCPLLGSVSSNVNHASSIINNHHMTANSLSTVPMTSEIPSAEIFYNPNQIIVARKFFKKQKRLAKRNNFDLQRQVDRVDYLDNVSDISSLTGNQNAHIYSQQHNAATLLRGGSKVNNTNIYYKSSNYTPITASKSPNSTPMESFRVINSDYFIPNNSCTTNLVANIYTNIPETKQPKHEIIKVRNTNRSCKPSCVETLSEQEEELENEKDFSDENKVPLYQNTLTSSDLLQQISLLHDLSSTSQNLPKSTVDRDDEATDNVGLLKVEGVENDEHISKMPLQFKTNEIYISEELQITNDENVDECSPAGFLIRLNPKHSKSLNNLQSFNCPSNRFLKYKLSKHSSILNLENIIISRNETSLSVPFTLNDSQKDPKSVKQITFPESFESDSDNNVFKFPHSNTIHSISPTNDSDLNYQNSEISIRSHGLYEPQPDNDLNITLTEELPYQSSSTSDTEDHLNDLDYEIQTRDYTVGHQSIENDRSVDELYEAIKNHSTILNNQSIEVGNNMNRFVGDPLEMRTEAITSVMSTPQPKLTFSSSLSLMSNPHIETCNDAVDDDSSQSSIISYIDQKKLGLNL